MDLYKKFIYINPDTTAGEFNTAQFFPVKYFRGIECATMVDVTITTGKCKEFCKEFAEHINYSKEAFIVLADAVAKEGFSALIDHDTAVTHTIGS